MSASPNWTAVATMPHNDIGPPENEVDPGGATNDAEAEQQVSNDTTNIANHSRSDRQAAIASQQVSWWQVSRYVAPLLERVVSWPMLGTPEWSTLPQNDVRKIAAVYDGARHWALRLECSQLALAEASRDIAAATDWNAISREMLQRNGVYIPREAS